MLKKILIGLGVLILLFIVLVVGAFFFAMHTINSASFADSIKKQIQTSTGAEVQFSEHSISLSELTLKNVAIPNPKASANEKILTVEEVHVLYSLSSIFKGSLEVPEITVTKPAVLLRQAKEGGLVLPVDLAQLKAKFAESQGNKPQTGSSPGMPVHAPNIKVIGAEVQVYADDGSLLFKAENANVTAAFTQTLTSRSAEGNLTVKQVTVMPAIKATDIKSPLKFENDVLSLTDILGTLYTGTLKANASLDTKASPMTFQTKANLDSIDMSGLMTGVGSDPQTLLGKLQLNFQGNGNLDAPKELLGDGTLKIIEVQVPKLKDLKILGQILGVSALKEGRFDAVESDFKIAGQKIQLQPLDIKSQNLNVSMNGPVGFDKQLDLKGSVNMEPGVVKILVTMAGIKTIEGGVGLPITIQGPVNDPDIRLDGKKIKEILAVIDPGKAAGQIIDAGSSLFNNLVNPQKDAGTAPADGATAPTEKKGGLFDNFLKPKATPTPTPTPPPAPAEPQM